MFRLAPTIRQIIVQPAHGGHALAKKTKASKKSGGHVQVSASVMQSAFAKPKAGADEKYGQHLLEYAAEYAFMPSDGHRKKATHIQYEREMTMALERLLASEDLAHDARLAQLISRQNEALEAMPEAFVVEATALESASPPLNTPGPRLTPPLQGCEPGFGMDVPQLQAPVVQYPPRGCDLPNGYVDISELRALTNRQLARWEEALGRLRERYPYTGPEGEQFELYCFVNLRALRRQLLLLDLYEDPGGLGERMRDPGEARRERERRGIVEVEVEAEGEGGRETEGRIHFAQRPKYHPFRED